MLYAGDVCVLPMRIMEHIRWDVPRFELPPLSPRCFFCGLVTEPTVLYRAGEVAIRGWKCSRCGFTTPHAHDIPKAVSLHLQ